MVRRWILACWLGVACSTGPVPEAAPGLAAVSVRQTDIATLKSDLDGGRVKLLIDVRTPEEYANGHVPGALNLPLDQLEGRVKEIPDPASEVHVICQSGRRSQLASSQLAALGFRPVNVQGGTAGWISQGYPVE